MPYTKTAYECISLPDINMNHVFQCWIHREMEVLQKKTGDNAFVCFLACIGLSNE